MKLGNIDNHDFVWYLENQKQNEYVVNTLIEGSTVQNYKLVTVITKDKTVNSLVGIFGEDTIQFKLK